MYSWLCRGDRLRRLLQFQSVKFLHFVILLLITNQLVFVFAFSKTTNLENVEIRKQRAWM